MLITNDGVTQWGKVQRGPEGDMWLALSIIAVVLGVCAVAIAWDEGQG